MVVFAYLKHIEHIFLWKLSILLSPCSQAPNFNTDTTTTTTTNNKNLLDRDRQTLDERASFWRQTLQKLPMTGARAAQSGELGTQSGQFMLVMGPKAFVISVDFLQGYTLSGSWNWQWSCNLPSSTSILGQGMLTSILTSMPKVHTYLVHLKEW